jgi:hypothetical protein
MDFERKTSLRSRLIGGAEVRLMRQRELVDWP